MEPTGPRRCTTISVLVCVLCANYCHIFCHLHPQTALVHVSHGDYRCFLHDCLCICCLPSAPPPPHTHRRPLSMGPTGPRRGTTGHCLTVDCWRHWSSRVTRGQHAPMWHLQSQASSGGRLVGLQTVYSTRLCNASSVKSGWVRLSHVIAQHSPMHALISVGACAACHCHSA
jgi:hypothetical protein